VICINIEKEAYFLRPFELSHSITGHFNQQARGEGRKERVTSLCEYEQSIYI
jgi:hypothetical protein